MNKKFDINNEDSRKLLSRIVLGMVAIFGIIFIILGALAIYQQHVYKTDYNNVVGKVISNMTDGEGRFIPTYVYEVDGQTYYAQSDYAFVERPEIGTEHIIYYLPEKVAYGIPEYFDANELLLVIGAMMLTLPLAIYLLDFDSQSYDRYASLKGYVVAILGVLYYCASSVILGTFDITYIFKYSGVLVIVPIVYVVIGLYVTMASHYVEEKKPLFKFKFKK